jgi:hypothetical protein
MCFKILAQIFRLQNFLFQVHLSIPVSPFASNVLHNVGYAVLKCLDLLAVDGEIFDFHSFKLLMLISNKFL